MTYTLPGACKAQSVNPQEWLAKVFEELPNRKVNNLDDLLPENFKTKNSISSLCAAICS
jgi:hypothetical protein